MSTIPVDSPAVTILPDGRMTARNAARYLGLNIKTLSRYRCDGTGPRYIKRGRIFYFREDLDAWLNAAGRVLRTAETRRRKWIAEGADLKPVAAHPEDPEGPEAA